jgi:sarcosine oxidase subunit delta
MLQIACPHCGPREQTEFRWGGESHVQRPGPPDAVSDAAWGAYLFSRRNPKGVTLERWLHEAGCGQWFNIARSTVDHRIVAVYRMGDPTP